MLGLADLAKLRGSVQAAVEQGLAITGRLEHGKASTPLTDRFNAVLDALEQQQFYLAVLEISPGAAEPLISRWGLELSDLWDRLPAEISAVEVRFQGQGYGWQSNGSRLHNAETLQDVYDQISEANGRGGLGRRLLVFYAPGDAAWAGTRILLLRSAELLTRDPNLMLLLYSAAHMVAVCCAADTDLRGAESGHLGEILNSAQAVLPVVTGAGGQAGPGTWANPTALGGSCTVLDAVETTHGQPVEHAVLEHGSPQRLALQYTMLARKLRDAVDGLLAELEREGRAISARQAALAESEREQDEGAKGRDARGELERIKLLVEDGTTALMEHLEEVNRRTTQRKGALTQLVRALSASVNQASLTSVTSTRKIRKSLAPALVAQHTSEITKALRAQFMQDVELISSKLQETVAQVDRSLAAAGVEKPAIRLAPFDHQKTWQYLQGELSLEGKGEVEVEKATGVMFFMNGARSIIMPIFMTLSMVGINLRSQLTRQSSSSQFGESGPNWFGPMLMISGFILAGLYFFFEKRKERDEQVYRDLNKIRDSLLGEATRMISDVQRDKVSRITSYVDDARKSITRQAEQLLKSRFEQSQREQERQKREVKARLRALDAASRELVEDSRQLTRVQQACTEIAGTCAKLLVEAAPVRTAPREALERSAAVDRPAREPLPERPPRLSLAERRAMRERG